MIAAIAVVIIVILAALLFAGVFKSGGGGSAGMGTAVTFAQAVPVAASEGQTAVGGPWTIVAAIGIGVSSGVTQTSPATFSGSGCTYSTPSGASSVASVLGTPSNATAGAVATWVFLAKNASANVTLMVEVSNGQASLWAFVTGCSGVSTFASMGSIAAGGVVDSSAVATEFNANGGSAFLKNATSVTQFFILLGASTATSGSAFWEVSYSTCSLLATSGTGSDLVALYYATSGSVFSGPTASQVTC